VRASSAKTILVVDDDLDIRETLAELLQDEGYTVVLAAHGGEALDVLRRNPRPALILLDLMMPIMNGWQFRAEQQRDPEIAGIPVVIISAAARDDAISGLGPAQFLKKPINLDQLLAAVEEHCS
jgi:CheY-like chemotaxis protein